MDKISIIGLDLVKRSFQAHGARADGGIGFRKKLSREKVLGFFAEQPRCVAAMPFRHPGRLVAEALGEHDAVDNVGRACPAGKRDTEPFRTYLPGSPSTLQLRLDRYWISRS